jgi:hypothetical protein
VIEDRGIGEQQRGTRHEQGIELPGEGLGQTDKIDGVVIQQALLSAA